MERGKKDRQFIVQHSCVGKGPNDRRVRFWDWFLLFVTLRKDRMIGGGAGVTTGGLEVTRGGGRAENNRLQSDHMHHRFD